MRRRTLSILALSLICVAALVAVALAATTSPNLDHALEVQRRLATEHPQDPAVFNDLGNLLLLAHRTAEAEAAYRKAVELDPQRVSALFNLGLLLQQRGERREALREFEQVVQIQPEHAWAHYQIGAIHEARKDESKAIEEYARAFSLDPQLAFPEVNPHIVDNKLVTQAMLRAYRDDSYGTPQAPTLYEDPRRIAGLLVPSPQQPADANAPTKDATAAKPAQQQQPGTPAAPGAPGAVIRPNDLDTRVTGQAGPQGSVRRPMPGQLGQPGQPGGRSNLPRGSRQWERPEPTIQYPNEGQQEVQPPVPAPGQVVTPPAGGVYYRPGYQSTGRLNLQIGSAKREGRG